MTLAQANAIFKTTYPTGEIFAHGFGDGSSESTSMQRTALVFKQGGNIYSYRSSYEGTLKKLGLLKNETNNIVSNNSNNSDDEFWSMVDELN